MQLHPKFYEVLMDASVLVLVVLVLIVMQLMLLR
jgi:hypothetical protein